MKRTTLSLLALAALLSSAAHAAEIRGAHPRLDRPAVVKHENALRERAEQEYARKLAEYRKDLAAYEADPTIWTVAIPTPPEKPQQELAAKVQAK